MRAGDGGEDGDDDEQHRAGRKRVAKQRDRLITAGEVLGHDAGADHRHHQDERAERFRRQAAASDRIALSPCPPRYAQQQPPLDLTEAAALVANGIDVPQPGKMP